MPINRPRPVHDLRASQLSDSLTMLGFDIFSTVCLTRADQTFGRLLECLVFRQ